MDSARHEALSTISINTFLYSKGKISGGFLDNAGVPEPFINYMPALIAAMEPIQFFSCFISYSNKDREFAQRLYADLKAKGVRCFFAPEDLKIGDRFRDKIERSIQLQDKFLVILSANSVRSKWVQTEVETAFDREHRESRSILFPIRLDKTVLNASEAWAADIRRTRQMGDFSEWKDDHSYNRAFHRLMRDLRANS